MNERRVGKSNPPEPPPFLYAERTAAFLGAFEERDTVVQRAFWALLGILAPLLILSYWLWPSNISALFAEFVVTVYAVTNVPRSIGCYFLRQRLAEVNERFPLAKYDEYFFE